MSKSVEKVGQDKPVLSENRYFLIFKDDKNQLLRIERDSINEIYKMIVDLRMQYNSYYVMKGNVVI